MPRKENGGGFPRETSRPPRRGEISRSDDQEELDEEQRGDHIGQRGDVLGLAGEDLDDQ